MQRVESRHDEQPRAGLVYAFEEQRRAQIAVEDRRRAARVRAPERQGGRRRRHCCVALEADRQRLAERVGAHASGRRDDAAAVHRPKRPIVRSRRRRRGGRRCMRAARNQQREREGEANAHRGTIQGYGSA